MIFSQYVTRVFGQAALMIRKDFNSTGVPYSNMITGMSPSFRKVENRIMARRALREVLGTKKLHFVSRY